ncbi:M23 family metallopeptidase [Sphingomonas crusticola]|uniref:M23 family metallopeptidase n=1 Tax=Sphingomonas crusticola TaxID=1697973 RepID=UPI000E27FD30|nr:M23 family metallopeptidase [Sphingomonas crusticola]
MTRLGWFLLLFFLLVIGGFALIVNKGGRFTGSSSPATSSPVGELDANAGGGGLVIPVAGVNREQLTDTWGDARGDGTRQHHAIDIMAPRGTPVLAAAAGTVEKIFESANGGHTVYIRRADTSWQDYYAHLDSYAADLREGIEIKQGQQIGTVGSTGDASPDGPHLHYEIHRMAPGDNWSAGTELNPYPILRG